MASLANVEHRNQDATVYVGNLDPLCTEKVLLELFAQVGKVKSVYMPTDKITNTHNGYGFIEFLDVVDADYAIQILNMIKFYNRPLKVSKSSLHNSKTELWSKDVGANLFIGNLDPIHVDEHLLYDTFGAFGTLIKQPKIMRDEDTNESKGFGFVSYDSFEASDNALECMNGQYLSNRQIVVQYAFKKDTHLGGKTDGNSTYNSHERHGSRAERMLAAQRKKNTPTATTAKIGVGSGGMIGGITMGGTGTPGNMPPPPPPPMPLGSMMGHGSMPPPPPPLPVGMMGGITAPGSLPNMPPPPPPPITPGIHPPPPPPPPPLQ